MCLTVGSVFSGIGGIELGLERCGMKTFWQVEKDPYCRAVLRKHWPNTEQFDDICTAGSHNLAPVDVICGGFPCQDISLAGKGAGLDGGRSGLWFEYVRIVRELRPRFVLVENVSALLTRGLDRVLGSLAEIGYDAEWDCIPASYVGAPHRRDRIWIVAYPGSKGRWEDGRSPSRDEGSYEGRSTPGYHLIDGDGQSSGTGHVADAQSKRSREAGELRHLQSAERTAGSSPSMAERRSTTGDVERNSGRRSRQGWWDIEPDVGRVANGVPSRVDRLRALGNAVVPQAAEERGRRIVELARERAVARIADTRG